MTHNLSTSNAHCRTTLHPLWAGSLVCADTRLKCSASCSPVHTTITSHCTVYSHVQCRHVMDDLLDQSKLVPEGVEGKAPTKGDTPL